MRAGPIRSPRLRAQEKFFNPAGPSSYPISPNYLKEVKSQTPFSSKVRLLMVVGLLTRSEETAPH